jgi:nucleoid DNA-binding protein
MRVKVDYRTSSKECYKDFCLKYPSIKLTYNEWLEIIYNFNEEFRNHILETGDKCKLPMGLGSFSVTKKKRKQKKGSTEYINLPVDWKKTREKGKRIFNFNFHTDSYFFGWKWFKREARFKHAALFYFKPSRVSSRMINHYIKTNPMSQHIYKEWGGKT